MAARVAPCKGSQVEIVQNLMRETLFFFFSLGEGGSMCFDGLLYFQMFSY